MKFFQLIPSGTNIDFIGKFKIFMAMSVIMLFVILGGMFSKGLNYGVDFTGGVVMNIRFHKPQDPAFVRHVMVELHEEEASVVAMGTDNRDYLITTRSVKEGKDSLPLNKRLIDKVGAGELTIQSMDMVGPKVGAELKKAAMLSLFYSVLLITIYIWFRFDFRFAPGATIAMVHDISMVTGFYLLTGREFTITAIAALLTIAGYSVNDTIVVYDRVREMYKRGGKDLPLATTINQAVNLTLSRTVIQSGVTLISILPIIFFCTSEIQSFAIAMVFGIFVGTYSTVYIAAPFTIYVERYQDWRAGTKNGATRPIMASARDRG